MAAATARVEKLSRAQTLRRRVYGVAIFLATMIFALLPSTNLPRAEEGDSDAGNRPEASESIGILYDSSLRPKVLRHAIRIWERCHNYGIDFPTFRIGEEGTSRTVRVNFKMYKKNPGRRKRCGWLAGNTIALFGFSINLEGKVYSCGALTQNLAHELGHVLGLPDAPSTPVYAKYIMADLGPLNLYSRYVKAPECEAAGRAWNVRSRTGLGALARNSEDR